VLRNFTCYVAGVATVAIAYSLGSGAPGTLGFVLWSGTTLLGAAWLLCSRKRAQWVARFLLRMTNTKTAAAAKPVEVKSVEPKNQVYVQVVSAMRNLGADAETARFAAGQATTRLPGADFEKTFRFAMRVLTDREAA
jgi:hypothetical protein